MDFYHVLNRGVDKRKVFLDDRDHVRFLHDLYAFNDVEPSHAMNGYHFRKNLHVGHANFEKGPRELLVNIHCFALMPNHYHLLLSPLVENGIALFMKKLNAGYTKYFNNRYKRSGALWQGGYKSVSIVEDSHFLFIPYYIHFNPLDLSVPEWREGKIKDPTKALAYLEKYRWSSHLDYLGKTNFPSITQRNFLLEIFGGTRGYAKAIAREMKQNCENHTTVTLE